LSIPKQSHLEEIYPILQVDFQEFGAPPRTLKIF